MREKKECAILSGIEVEQSKDGRKVKYLENNLCLIKKWVSVTDKTYQKIDESGVN